MGATAYIEANGLHSAPDAMASEYEVHELLYSLVRLLKPKVILETGCYLGHATTAMARGVRENGVGEIWTCDTDEKFAVVALESVNSLFCSGEELATDVKNVDFAFLDSSGDRVAECAALHLAPNGLVVVHDTNRPQYDAIKLLRPWKSVWKIDTPRGLTIFQS